MAFPTTEEQVDRAEKEIGLALPPQLRERLLAENGGEIAAGDDVWELFPVQDTSDRKHVARTANHVLRETEEARKWPDFPSEAVAIASNGTGDYLILRPSDRASGQLSDTVFLWNHETGSAAPIDVDWSVQVRAA